MAVVYGVILILVALSSAGAASGKSMLGCYKSIVSFGDSLADTGNILVPSAHNRPPLSANPPYGRTYFHRPTGRFSDGRLVIDFIAQSLGLPLLKPYVAGETEDAHQRGFNTGVNLAVAGATALEYEFYNKIGFHNPDTNVSLGTQLDWFRKFLDSLPDGRTYLESSLVVLGEIGGNDYSYPLQQGTTLEVLKSFVPAVVTYIGSTIQELIKHGAVTMLVPGIVPTGCLPVYLTQFQESSTKKNFDPTTGCLNWLNELSKYHNELLVKELRRIRELHPHVNIIYADCYNAANRFYLSPDEFGFGSSQILRACCGGGGSYNYNGSARCGLPQATCCDDPATYASWDGIHWTEAGYRLIAEGLVEGPFTDPPFATMCPHSISQPGGSYDISTS